MARKKFATCLSASDCKAFIDAAMQPLMRVASKTELVHTAMNLQHELNYSFYDCLMIAAALEAGADTSYTENLQHRQLVHGTLRIVNPFLGVVHEV